MAQTITNNGPMTQQLQTGRERLPRLIAKAAAALASATTAAEILDAQDAATFAYDAAKAITRLAKVKNAHDEVVTSVRKAQADALDIECRTKCRLAEEYDAAQARGEVATRADGSAIRDHVSNENKVATVTDIGLTRKQVHEARKIRDAEKANPGVVRSILDRQLQAGEEPTRAQVKRAVNKILHPPEKPHAAAKEPKSTRATLTRQLKLGDDYERVKGTSLDSPKELDALVHLAEHRPKEARTLIERAVTGKAVTATAVLAAKAHSPKPTKNELIGAWIKKMLSAWQRADLTTRDQFIEYLKETRNG
jgi:hypothetical protein